MNTKNNALFSKLFIGFGYFFVILGFLSLISKIIVNL